MSQDARPIRHPVIPAAKEVSIAMAPAPAGGAIGIGGKIALFGWLAGTVFVMPGIDLTAPACDPWPEPTLLCAGEEN